MAERDPAQQYAQDAVHRFDIDTIDGDRLISLDHRSDRDRLVELVVEAFRAGVASRPSAAREGQAHV